MPGMLIPEEVLTTVQFFPRCFASYSALSTSRTSFSGLFSFVGIVVAIPMLMVTLLSLR